MEAIVTETSDHALRYAVQTGSRQPLHCFSAGKAILATLRDEEVEAYFAATDRQRYTPATITDAAALRRDIVLTRQTGIARTREESTPGIQGVGRAVTIDGETVGAFSVAIPSARFDA